jgi:hypothetical protein
MHQPFSVATLSLADDGSPDLRCRSASRRDRGDRGAWLADQIGDGARYVKSKRAVVKKIGGQNHGITLQTSTWSRTGEGTWVSPRVWVTDPRVAAWQDERTLTGLFSRGGYILSTLIINLGLPNSVELFGPRRATEPETPCPCQSFGRLSSGRSFRTSLSSSERQRLPWNSFPTGG